MYLSIIVPVYNSENILYELSDRIFKACKQINLRDNFELLLINDCSIDNSWNKIKFLSKTNNHIKGINLSENFGQHNAIMAGFNNCKGDFIITMDDDLQHPPEFISKILDNLKISDVCYTNYRKRKHARWKTTVSKINNFVSSFLLSKPLNIYMSSYRGLRRFIIDDIIKYKDPEVYIDGLILSSTNNIKMITVDHHPRKEGKSNYDLKKLLILWSNMLINFSFFPIRIVSPFGILLKYFVKIFRKKTLKPQYEIIEIL